MKTDRRGHRRQLWVIARRTSSAAKCACASVLSLLPRRVTSATGVRTPHRASHPHSLPLASCHNLLTSSSTSPSPHALELNRKLASCRLFPAALSNSLLQQVSVGFPFYSCPTLHAHKTVVGTLLFTTTWLSILSLAVGSSFCTWGMSISVDLHLCVRAT